MADPLRIIWKKWHDPLTAAVAEHRERGWHDGYDYTDRPGQAGAYAGPCLYGAAGIIPLNELNCPSRNFNLWVGHASFDIDVAAKARIMAVSGVEMFRVWTRYRFWLGVGSCFCEDQVKAAVREAATPPASGREGGIGGVSAVRALSRNLAGRHPFWAIFVSADGKYDVACGEEREAVERAVLERRAASSSVLTSWGGCEVGKD